MRKRVLLFLFVLAGVSLKGFGQTWQVVVTAEIENNGWWPECNNKRTYDAYATFNGQTANYNDASSAYATVTFTGTGTPASNAFYISATAACETSPGFYNYDGPSAFAYGNIDVSYCHSGQGSSSDVSPGIAYVTYTYVVSYTTTLTAPGGNTCGNQNITLTGTPGFPSYNWQFATNSAGPWQSFETTSSSTLTFSKQSYSAIPYGQPVFFRYLVKTTCAPPTISGSYTFYAPPPSIASFATTTPQCRDGKGGTITVNHTPSSIVSGQSYTYTIVQLVKTNSCPPQTIATPPDMVIPAGYCPLFKTNAVNSTGAATFQIDTTKTTDATIKFIPAKYLIKVEASNATSGLSCFARDSITISNPAAVSATLASRTSPSCQGGNDGTATFTVNNGLGPFTWKIRTRPTLPTLPADFTTSTSSAGRTILVTNLPAEKYTFLIESDNCGDSYSVDFEILASGTLLTLGTPALTNPSCYTSGVGNGSFTIATNQVGSHTSGYTFKLFNNDDLGAGELTSVPKTMNTNLSATYSSLNHGVSYKVEVTSPNGCTDSEIITLSSPSAINGSSVETHNTCHGGATGAISFNQTFGSTNLSYGLEKENASFVYQPFTTGVLHTANKQYTGLPAGVYRLTVTDNCLTTASGVTSVKTLSGISITEPDALEFVTTLGRILDGDEYFINCVDGTKDLLLEFQFGTAPYTVTLVKNTTTTIPVGNGPSVSLSLGVGDYSVMVSDNCNNPLDNISLDFSIKSLASLSLDAIITKSDLTCPERDDGSLEVVISGGTPGAATNPYVVELLDDLGDPLTANITNVNNSYLISNLAEDIAYIVRVKDYNGTPDPPGGCIKEFDEDGGGNSLAIDAPDALEINLPDKSADFTGLALFEDELYAICKGDQNGVYTAIISGGNAPYTVNLFKKNLNTDPWQALPFAYENNVADNSAEFSGLGAGYYKVGVVDQQSCAFAEEFFEVKEAAANVQVESITAAEFAHGANTKCHDTSDASITIEASGGVGNYTYFITGDTYIQPVNRPESLHTFTDLAAKKINGEVINYAIALHDTLGCVWSMTNGVNHQLELTSPDTVKFSWDVISDFVPGYEIPCRNDEAKIQVTSEGGHFPHEISITGQIPQSLTSNSDVADFSLRANTYTASFTDALGCPAPDQTIELREPDTHITAAAGTISFAQCVGNNDGQIEVSATGGIRFPDPNDFLFLIRKKNASAFDTDTLRGENVTFFRPANYFVEQDYEIMSIDAHGCSDTIPVIMTVNQDPLTLTSIEQVSPSCYGGTDGYLTVTASNHDLIGGTSLRFKLSGGHLGNTILDTLVDGATVTFKDLQGTDLNGYTAYRVWVEDANNCQDTAYQYMDDLFLPSFEKITASLIESIRPSCFNGTDGSLLVKISGGVAPYQYSLNSTTFFNVDPADNIIFIDNLTEGTYTFYVIDSNYQPSQLTCLSETSFDVAPGRFIKLTTATTRVSCVGGNDGAINLTVDLENLNEPFQPSRFSLFWTYDNLSPADPISTQEDISGLPAGRYTVHATYDVDSLTCVNQAGTTIQQPGNGVFRISDVIIYDASCGGMNNDGIATVSVTGGWPNAPSYYRVDTTIWIPFSTASFMLSGLSPGEHSIEISQSSFECNDSKLFTVGSASMVLTLGPVIKPSCPLNADGTVIVTSPSANAQFALEGSAFQSLGVFTGLAKGTYRFIARHATQTSCQSEVLVVDVEDPADCGDGPLTLILGDTAPATCATVQDGQAEVVAAGGVPPYQFFWDESNIPGPGALNNLLPGNHSVKVIDAINSSVTIPVVIDTLDLITFQAFTTLTSCLTSCDGTATLLIAGGSDNPTVLWQGFTGSSRQELCAGQYDVTISDNRNPDCNVTGSVSIGHFPDLQIELITARSPVCPGGTDGYLDTDVSGGSEDYTIVWSNATPGERLNGHIPGDYTISVIDNELGCTKEMTFTLPDATPITVLSATVTSPKCFGGSDGKIVLDAGNVSAPLVEWDNGQIGLTASGLKAGTYGYKITGASGCSITGSEEVTERLALTVSPAPAMPTCFGVCNGSASLAISGGVAPYAIRWSHGPRTSSVVNLCEGTYSYTVTDNLNCQVSGTVVITSPAEVAIAKTSDIKPACFGDSNGSMTIEASGGTGNFAYSWNSGQTSPSITGVTAGDYVVTVTDENQCSRSKTFSLTGPSALFFHQDKVTQPSCLQSTDGKIIPNPTGGTLPYGLLWDDQSTALIKENLSAGQYTLRVTDANGCTIQKTYGLQAPSSLAIVNVISRDPLCFNDENGSISLDAIGGTSPYTFSWNNSATAANITDLSAGQYFLTVTDQNGCTSVTSYTLDNPDQPVITGIPEKITICIGSLTTIEPEGEWIKYQWTGPQNFEADSRRIETYLSGAYTLNTLNSNGCPAQTGFTIETSKDALIADFLRLTEAVVYEPVVFVDISTPQPATLQWITPDNNDVIINKQSKENIEIVFTRSGTFEIGMIASMGNCQSEIYKTVVVAEPVEDPDNNGGRIAIDARPMSAVVYPNPARDEISIQVAVPARDPVDIWLISPVENRAFFHEKNEGQFDYLIQWNISKLTTGVYHLIYKQNNTTRSERIAVIR